MKGWMGVIVSILILVILVATGADLPAGSTANPKNSTELTPWVYLPYVSKQDEVIYVSSNLSGHSIAAECNPGGVSHCPCSEADVDLTVFEDHGEVTSNVREVHTYVNAIGYKKFTETFPKGDPITLGIYRYTGQFRLPGLPAPDPDQRENSEAAHMMIQFWDGRNARYENNKTTLEGTIFLTLNPWETDYKHVKVYVQPLQLVDTGIILDPVLGWHSFELIIDLATQRYVSITIDGDYRDLSGMSLAQVYHPEWGDDLSFIITTESLATWPQNDCRNIFKWTMWYKDLALSRLP
ncbi:MAG: hypothetical protein KC441_03730 [Anaerolineales bacterium]|nr:hypothetical protein [Anaerolineales bacterium]